MNTLQIAKRAERLFTDNSPAIFTALGVVGTFSAAYLTGKASFKAAAILDEQTYTGLANERREITKKQTFQLLWKLYMPAAGVMTLTVASIVAANRIGTRRTAAMAAAYTLSERAFGEYKEKITEKLGINKEKAARDELAQDRVNRNPVGNQQVFVTGGGDVLCYDTLTGRYFISDMETIKQAQNKVNYQINNSYYASLNDFYSEIGIARVPMGDDIGWNSDGLLEIEFSTTMSDDNRPCIVLDFRTDPIRGFSRVH